MRIGVVSTTASGPEGLRRRENVACARGAAQAEGSAHRGAGDRPARSRALSRRRSQGLSTAATRSSSSGPPPSPTAATSFQPRSRRSEGGSSGSACRSIPAICLLARRARGTPIIGAPGCARSPKENGFDWVLQRVLAGVPITRRRHPRDGRRRPADGDRLAPATSRLALTRVGAVVLAAGQSSRFRAAGGSEATKLVAKLDGKPIVRRVAEAALASSARPVVVVTGHARNAVEAALAGLAVAFAFNPDLPAASRPRSGSAVARCRPTPWARVVLLGDMPRRRGAADRRPDRLLPGAARDALAAAPSHEGRRGNPVLARPRLVRGGGAPHRATRARAGSSALSARANWSKSRFPTRERFSTSTLRPTSPSRRLKPSSRRDRKAALGSALRLCVSRPRCGSQITLGRSASF